MACSGSKPSLQSRSEIVDQARHLNTLIKIRKKVGPETFDSLCRRVSDGVGSVSPVSEAGLSSDRMSSDRM